MLPFPSFPLPQASSSTPALPVVSSTSRKTTVFPSVAELQKLINKGDTKAVIKKHSIADLDKIEKPTKYPYVTQHCANGAHENTKTLSFKGTLMVSCKGFYDWRFTSATCTCWCHALVASIKTPETVAPSDTSPTTGDPSKPVTVAPRPVKTAPLGPMSPSEDAMDPTHRMFRAILDRGRVAQQLTNLVLKLIFGDEVVPGNDRVDLPKERRKRGELDDNVEVVCRLWQAGKLPWGDLLTTEAIALTIDASDPPSQGAIYAVLTRWSEAGYCTIGTAPMRFVGFTSAVLEKGLSQTKHAHKREADRRSKGFF
jgi:hypothetical protein